MKVELRTYDWDGRFLWEKVEYGAPTVKDAILLGIDHADFDARIGKLDVFFDGTRVAVLNFKNINDTRLTATAHYRENPDAWVVPRAIGDPERSLYTQFGSKYILAENPDYKEHG